jgi:hypothetical protein
VSTLIEMVDERRWKDLFIEELGWSRPTLKSLLITLDDEHGTTELTVTEVAHYKGVRIWVCDGMPDARGQRFVDREVKKHSTERLLIFADELQQEWRWPQTSDSQGRGKTRLISHQHSAGRPNPALEQRLRMIEIKVSESPSILEVLKRLRAAFDADRVTKAFYDKFKKRHEALVKAIDGFPAYRPERTEDDRKTLNQERKWYSSLLLNRLMFIYFLQRKGFMAGDRDYLRNRLRAVRETSGAGRFFEFYADFLIPMFHDGLGDPGLRIKDPVIKGLVGKIPYINGGIFAVHELEEIYADTHIADDVFESIFDLFDAYHWHLDDRPTGDPNEINPDVLGHIFEQFINQKQMGAYYTKEDVTHFMTSSTLLPVFLERIESATGVNPWAYVAADPARYVWESMGVGLDPDLPYPDRVEQQRTSFPRPAWNEKAAQEWGLPGETWWEVDHRHRRYEQLLAAAGAGWINNADAAVTANIDLETLALDVIDGLDGPQDVVTVWEILKNLKVIDPTCGSGAFLFAALKILQALYDAVLDAARAHAVTSAHPGLVALLAEVDRHPNQQYFVLRRAALHNLYGVDLMKEATEIARLRLFLKLVAAIDEKDLLEPLPDLDFNIKPGNMLVGARTREEVAAAAEDLFSREEVLEQADAAADVVADAYATFVDVSEIGDDDKIKRARKTLVSASRSARRAINQRYYDGQGTSASLDDWVRTHVPFHWFIEFPGVFAAGGFDVVIGNPPYVARSKIKDYSFAGFHTQRTPDIYAPCTERAAQITRPDGRMTLIIPISAQFGTEFASLRKVLEQRFATLWVSAFSRNPAALFSAGLGVRSTIVVGAGRGGSGNKLFVTRTHRWVEAYRSSLFETLGYVDAGQVRPHAGWIRCVDDGLAELFARLAPKGRLSQVVTRTGSGRVGFKSIVLYWISVFDQDPPAYELDFAPTPQTGSSWLRITNPQDAKVVLAVLASKLAFVWWWCTSDDFHATNEGLTSTPVDLSALSSTTRQALADLADELIADFSQHVQFTKYAGKWMGNYVHSEMRDITDKIDRLLAESFGYVEQLPLLERAYYNAYKPTGDRPGTLRHDPAVAAKG